MQHCKKETARFLSSDGKTQVAAFFYTPNCSARAVLQLSHGMCEYICRYEPMIDALAKKGFAVCGNDHLGHGDTSPDQLGFMAEQNGFRFVLDDLHTMNRLGHEKYPGLPYFFMGHSMGSFFGRWYAQEHPETMDGLIISGTGGPNILMYGGKAMAASYAKIKGPRHVSQFLVNISMGSYCKKIDDTTVGNAWLSRDPSVWEAYSADPKCNFSFSVSAYRDLLTAYLHVNKADWARSIPKDMPVYIYSGEMDPVGAYGKGVKAVHSMLQKAGVRDLSIKLYPDARHEMHNETNKDEVFRDLISWMEHRI